MLDTGKVKICIGEKRMSSSSPSVMIDDVTYMDLAISYVNETAAHNDKVEHVPGVAEVVLIDRIVAEKGER